MDRAELDKLGINEMEALVETTTDEALKYELINNLAVAYANRQDIDTAMQWNELLRNHATETNNHAMLAKAHRLSGLLHRRTGNLDQAMEDLKTALGYLQDHEDEAARMPILEAIGSVYIQLDLYQEAREKFTEVYKLATSRKSSLDTLAVSAFNLAYTLVFFKEYNKALGYLNESLQIARKANMLNLQVNINIQLSIVHQAKGEREEAYKKMQDALAACDELGIDLFTASAMAQMAQLLIEQERYDEVEPWLDKANVMLEKLQDKVQCKRLYGYYTQFYRATKNYEKALEYSTLEHELDSELRSEQAMKKAHNLQVQLDMEQREKAIVLERAHHQKELSEARLQTLTKIASQMAHEVQNPLQFVINFSQLNVELNEELQELLEKGDLEEVMALNKEMIENNQKISEHGARISHIVKELQEQANKAQQGEIEIDTHNPHDFSQ